MYKDHGHIIRVIPLVPPYLTLIRLNFTPYQSHINPIVQHNIVGCCGCNVGVMWVYCG